jgi:hypothetical protein
MRQTHGRQWHLMQCSGGIHIQSDLLKKGITTMENDYYFVSYVSSDFGILGWRFHNALLNNKHPLEWISEMNVPSRPEIWRLLTWQKISEKEFNLSKKHIVEFKD